MAQMSLSTSTDTLGSLSIPDVIKTNDMETSDLAPSVSVEDNTNDEGPLTHSSTTNPSSYLGNVLLFMDNKEFFMLLQDRGELNIDIATNKPYVRKPHKRHYDKNHNCLYPNIYKCRFTLYNLYKNHTDIFVKFEQMKNNPSCDIDKICKWIMNKRESLRRTDINVMSYPEIYYFLTELPPVQNEDDNIVFVCSQKHILFEAV